MTPNIFPSTDYSNWLTALKQRVQPVLQRAILLINRKLTLLALRSFAKEWKWTKPEFVQQAVAPLPWEQMPA